MAQQLGIPVRCDGITLMGVPIGGSAFTQQVVMEQLRGGDIERLLTAVAGERDAQVAYTLLRLCGPARATYLSRNVAPAALRSELQRFDATLLCALAAVAQEPCTAAAVADDDGAAVALEDADGVRPMRFAEALAHIRAQDWDGQAPVTLSPPQQLQVHLRQRHGGLGIISTLHRAPAAFLGRTVEALGTALQALPAAHVARLRADDGRLLYATGTMRHAWASLAELRRCGEETAAALPELLPPAWCGDWGGGDTAATELAAPLDGAAAAAVALARRQARGALLATLLTPVESDSPECALPHRQAALVRHLDVAAAQALQAAIIDHWGDDQSTAKPRAVALAILRSLSSKGALAFLAAMPSSGLTMSGPAFREALRRILGIERAACGATCPGGSARARADWRAADHAVADTAGCQLPMTGAHLRRCMKTGKVVVRHDAIRDALIHLLRTDARIDTDRENKSPFALSVHPQWRMDIVVGAGFVRMPTTIHQDDGGRAGTAALIDVTVADCTGDTNCLVASQDIQAHLIDAAHDKYKKYAQHFNHAEYTLYPAPIDQFGAMSKDFLKLIAVFATRAAEQSNGQYTRAQHISRWRQTLSVALQRGNSNCVLSSWGKGTPTVDGVVPDYGAYTRVHLLGTAVPPRTPDPEPPPAPPPAPFVPATAACEGGGSGVFDNVSSL